MNIKIRKQKRKSLALQLTPKGVVVLIPQHLPEDHPQVKAFIQKSLESLPQPKSRLEQPHSIDFMSDTVSSWAETLKVEVKRVQIRDMTTKWGSISTAGTLTLTSDLRWLPVELVDYVIVHELLHLKFPNHDKGWQITMSMTLSDWREREKTLQRYTVSEIVPSEPDEHE